MLPRVREEMGVRFSCFTGEKAGTSVVPAWAGGLFTVSSFLYHARNIITRTRQDDMAFNGWENVKEGEEFSVEEIAAFYGRLGPYSLLEPLRRSLWGRYPLMTRAVAADGVEGLFKPGEKVRLFLREEDDGYKMTAFPEHLFDKEGSLRPFIGMAEEKAVQSSAPSWNEKWTDMFCARDYCLPFCDALQQLEPPYTEEQMEELYRSFADTYAEHENRCAMISGLYRTGATRFSAFCFALAREGMEAPDGSCYFAPWDVVLLFFELKEGGEFGAVATVPLRLVNFYDPKKLKAFAETLEDQWKA